jgi:hypothetical protein
MPKISLCKIAHSRMNLLIANFSQPLSLRAWSMDGEKVMESSPDHEFSMMQLDSENSKT